MDDYESLGFVDGVTWSHIVKNKLRGPFLKMVINMPFEMALKIIRGQAPGG